MQPLRREDHPELEALFRHYDETLSFVPNSLYTMARRPGILRAFSELITQIWNSGTLPKPLKPLIGIVSSIAAGCRYCQAHEAVDARERGVPDEKIKQIWNFERSTLYDEGERVALRFARDASLVPNEVTPEHFEALRLPPVSQRTSPPTCGDRSAGPLVHPGIPYITSSVLDASRSHVACIASNLGAMAM